MDEIEQTKQKIHNWLTLENVKAWIHHIFDKNIICKHIHTSTILQKLLLHETENITQTIYEHAYLLFYEIITTPQHEYFFALECSLRVYEPFIKHSNTNNTTIALPIRVKLKKYSYFPKCDEYLLKQFLTLQNVKLLFHDWFENFNVNRWNFCGMIYRMLDWIRMRLEDVLEVCERPSFYHTFYYFAKSYYNSRIIHNAFIGMEFYCNFVYYHHLFELRKRVLLICEDVYAKYDAKNVVHKLLVDDVIVREILKF
jgi:hypothetical protein